MSKELTAADFARSLERSQRKRIMSGELAPGDVAALRRFVGLTQVEFAKAMGISQALALLRIAARHPAIIHEELASVA